MRRPFVYISIPILLGIIFYYHVDINFNMVLILLVFSIIFTFIGFLRYKRFNSKFFIVFFFISFLLGIFISRNEIKSSVLLKYVGKPLELEAIVNEIDYIEENKVKVLVTVKKIKGESFHSNLSEKMVLTVIGNEKLDLYDFIVFKAVINEPKSNTNPKLYNYKLNLLSNGIFTTATIKEDSILKIEKSKLDTLSKIRVAVIDRVEKVFNQYLSKNNSSIMKSIVLGDNSYLEENTIDKFNQLGISHIFAISGLHIGLVSVILINVLSYVGVNRKINFILATLIMWIYAFIIGMPASVLRANITFSILFISQVFAKPYDSINTLFFALFVLIIINPFFCFNLGFQLSFVTSLFIIYLTPKIKMKLNDSGIFSATLAAQIGILPIISYYFNMISVIGIIANVILIPLFTLALILSIFLMPISYISSSISRSIALLIDVILNFQDFVSEILFHFPVLTVRVHSPSIYEIIVYYILIFLIVNKNYLSKLPKEIIKTMFYYIIFIFMINLINITYDSSLTVDFIDVGQGDSILLRTRHWNYLIDTGGSLYDDNYIGENIVLPYLIKHGIFELDGIFITHFHEDHVQSLPYLMDNIKINKLYIGYKKENDVLYQNIIKKAKEKEIPIFILKKGDYLKLDQNTYILCLGPSEDLINIAKNNDNELSLILLLKHFNNEILFTGDVESLGEKNIIKTLKKDIDFIKVPHHGSNTSSSEELLLKTKPKVAFITVGKNNLFGHPHDDVLKRYELLGIEIYRTDESGLIKLVLNSNNYAIETFLKTEITIRDILNNNLTYFLISYLILLYLMIKYFLSLIEELEKIEL